MDLRRVFDCMISVSELGRGQASRVIQAVEDEGSPYIVVKNNKPQAVIISVNEYTDLMRARELLDSMKTPAQNPAFNNYMNERSESLTLDEINIFLEDEEND